jgi:hypothetical protein
MQGNLKVPDRVNPADDRTTGRGVETGIIRMDNEFPERNLLVSSISGPFSLPESQIDSLSA